MKVHRSTENITFTFCVNPTDGKADYNTWTYGLYVNLKVEDPIFENMVLWSLIHIHLKLYVCIHSKCYIWMMKWGDMSSKKLRENHSSTTFHVIEVMSIKNTYNIHDDQFGTINYKTFGKNILHESK